MKMKPEIKQKIKKSMMDHLKSVGYPDISSDKIINELPNLWNKLTKENLVQEFTKDGFTYKVFVKAALTQKEKWDQINRMKAMFSNFHFKAH